MQKKRQKTQFFNERFTKYCDSFGEEIRKYIYSRIMSECEVSMNVIYDWRRGRTPINKLTRDKINEIVGEDIFGKEATCE